MSGSESYNSSEAGKELMNSYEGCDVWIETANDTEISGDLRKKNTVIGDETEITIVSDSGSYYYVYVQTTRERPEGEPDKYHTYVVPGDSEKPSETVVDAEVS